MKNNEALLGGWKPSEIRQQQLEDENIGKVFAALEAGTQKPPLGTMEQIRNTWRSFIQKKQTRRKELTNSRRYGKKGGRRHCHSVASEQPTFSRKRKYSPSRPLVDKPELAVARIDLSSRGKIAYLRMKESSAEIWFKVELVHWVMENSKAKDNLLRRMGIAKIDYDPPQTFGTELKLMESKHTLNQVTKALGIRERHARKLFRGKVTFEVKSRKTTEEPTKDETSCRSDI
ncbi:unnamed protein product [Mytilus coruscus]|uniref:Uncharacterized protein n=1 Tax=Mytilus coruscus TaxID=42192 RepID=A0A6J8D8Y2_MYTCO|nr:unnamed protein product [Mytilus coruscus]